MPDDVNEHEFDAHAAEYVLGTLDASERAHTHVLLGIDDGFAARVKRWERRLGELHVMVEPVDPDWRVWERIKDKIGGFQSNPFYVAQSNKGVEPARVAQPAERRRRLREVRACACRYRSRRGDRHGCSSPRDAGYAW